MKRHHHASESKQIVRRVVPAGRRIYAIGDIHGEASLLAQLIGLVESDNRERPVADTEIVFLGDLIDRGAQSAEVVLLLMRLADSARVTVLLGNHEATLIDIYDGDRESACDCFAHFGGAATLASFGFDISAIDPADAIGVVAAVRHGVPHQVIDWLRDRPIFYRVGDYYFVHAGIRPGVPLARQQRADLLWIRDPFLTSMREYEALIVHGHTVEGGEPTVRDNRIGIDTGAYSTGRLTALGLEGEAVWHLQTHHLHENSQALS
ncbi:metallophosphoesterase family protein [Sphingomonas panni]